MAKKKQSVEPIDEVCELLKKTLVLSLFEMNVSQAKIAKKLRMDTHIVNDFLKGLKKK
ncbi:MAG: hypothetical protein WC643_01640 [Parcubacteria group bacterium]|jgi:hypothetical protein